MPRRFIPTPLVRQVPHGEKLQRVPSSKKLRLPQSGRSTPLVRPPAALKVDVTEKVTRLKLPHGCFNAGMIRLETGRYVCVYRPDERSFTACFLDEQFNIVPGSQFPLGITNCADPRLVWTPRGHLLMVYSSTEEGGQKLECIRAGVIMEPGGTTFVKPVPFRVSPQSNERQKNWVPFLHDDHLLLISSTRPHTIYELDGLDHEAEKKFETDWVSPWFCDEFFRGNTNPVRLDDGNYLGTFHTVLRQGKMHYYDNGCYVFEGQAPFRVLRAGRTTYLPAESAVEPHFRKKGLITVCFPVGMVRAQEKLFISYGDNDSSVKVMQTSVEKMLKTTLEVY